MKLISTVGGASGPLYGTLFLRLATALGRQTELDRRPTRGRHSTPASRASWPAARPSPATRPCSTRSSPPWTRCRRGSTGPAAADALAAAAAAAEQGMLATIPLVARKGRASYLGERSAGHQDPGRDLHASPAQDRSRHLCRR